MLWFSTDEDAQDLAKETSQQRVERRLILQKAIKLHQQTFIFTEPVVDLANI